MSKWSKLPHQTLVPSSWYRYISNRTTIHCTKLLLRFAERYMPASNYYFWIPMGCIFRIAKRFLSGKYIAFGILTEISHLQCQPSLYFASPKRLPSGFIEKHSSSKLSNYPDSALEHLIILPKWSPYGGRRIKAKIEIQKFMQKTIHPPTKHTVPQSHFRTGNCFHIKLV